jgi:hypothetical protein
MVTPLLRKALTKQGRKIIFWRFII